MNDSVRYWVATAPVGAASVLAEELRAFGAVDIRERSHDVKFQGTLEVGYRTCLWSRTATRVLLSLGSVEAGITEELFEGLKRFDWSEHLAPGATLACDCSGGNAAIRHTIYGSQLLKDAVCDHLREATGERPVIRPERPDVLLHLHVEGPTALVSVDFSGESLHRRGYRSEGGRAPLKENVAAAVLLRAGWPQIAAEGGTLVDPMCGSGTFLTEAALIASGSAPALERDYFGFLGWHGHDAGLWSRLREEASMHRAAQVPRRCIIGSDIDGEAVRMAIANAEHAGVLDWVHIEKRPLESVTPPRGPAGLLVANPPYGERIGADSALAELYTGLGRLLRERFRGWQAAILTGNLPLARNLGIYAKRTHRVFNGAIECRLLRFDLTEESERPSPEERRAKWSARPGAQMFANRVRKNLDRLETWAAKEGIECFRLYDADMPEYAFAVDIYGREPRHVYVQEYSPPKTVDPESARERRREVLTVLPEALSVPLERVHSRVRKSQKGTDQYQRRSDRPPARADAYSKPAAAAERVKVSEGGLEFWVNFRDYLDTGLFLDHRITRRMLREWARGGDFLNLFCYTGSATVYAAAGGARSSVSVDLSNTYLEWAHDNLVLNGFGGREHTLQRADCLEWLANQEAGGAGFDLIFVDPPTFSNSKRMEGVLDVQRDHVGMIRRSLSLLRPTGRLVFSTNYTRFKLDTAALADLEVDDISARTLPKDFERNPHIHRCFVIRPRGTP
jgi:23S rRNA (guanine2445-N2)-methyltransferase / 23S rRNA (guanine2069-N7)-methyltransferase